MAADLQVRAVIQAYFDGVYQGDVVALAAIFDQDAVVSGAVDGRRIHKPIAAYLAGVAARRSPQQSGEPYRMALLALDVCGNIASARLHSPMLGYDYYLYLTLLLHAGVWKIVSKTFTNHQA